MLFEMNERRNHQNGWEREKEKEKKCRTDDSIIQQIGFDSFV